MWSLCVLLLCVLLSLGQGRDHTEIFTRPGSSVTLHMRYQVTVDHQDTAKCDEIEWKWNNSATGFLLVKSRRCNVTKYVNKSVSNYEISEDGNLTLYNVTTESAGDYTVTVRNTIGTVLYTEDYTLHVHIPLSHVAANISCLPDGSAQASCWVDNGTNPSYSWSLDGKSLQGRSISTYSQISLPSPVSGNLTCNVTNNISDISKSIIIFCPVPLSDPLLRSSCLQNGSTEISCSVLNGTDPSFYLTVNGELLVDNYISPQRRVNHTVSLPGPWSVNCSVRNNISEKSATITDKTCPVPLSVPVVNYTCQADGSASVLCDVENGMDASYNWTVNGELIQRNNSNITLSNKEFGEKRISCSVMNPVSKKSSNETEIFCPAPVSDPVLNVSCLQNGSAVISCWVLSGTRPLFSLTVNGGLKVVNSSSSWAGLNYTESSGGPWNVSCSVRNQLRESVTGPSYHTCPAGASCLSCLEKSVMWGTVVLIVTTTPLIIASVYTVYSTKQSP
ncbi:uncharacterized protein LOC142139687 isoform X2 [Mixophyes fleayi]|uniref:uncharacterized protein LOC142139687 isoform X2 n=1 Tax=Mixophyes fleayi TaxID=3061075 RepID=UPI003F4E4319